MGQLESFNPATGELIGAVETLKPDQVQAVVDDVAEVQPFWAQLTLADRSRYLRRAADVLVEEVDEIAELLTREQGKPITESYTMEVVPTIDVLHWCAQAGPKILADEPIRMGQALFLSKKAKFSYEPLGVVGVIAPWNYPWSIPFDEVAMALMAGNGVVLKPASLTPLLGERIRETFEKAGLPEGLVRVVHGGGAVGGALCESSARKIFFTGSVEVGRKVGEICARQLKGSVLELGGKDPQIVCADADLDNAISGCVWGGFANAGQTCSGIERTYVVDEVADRFLEGVVAPGGGADRRRSDGVGDGDRSDGLRGPVRRRHRAGRRRARGRRRAGGRRAARGRRASAASSSPRRCWRGSRTRCGSCGRRSSARWCRSSSSTPRRRRCGAQTTPTSASAPRSGPRTAPRASGWRGGSSPGWCGSTTTPTPTPPASARGAASRSPGLGRSHSKFGFYECVDIKLVSWEPGLTRDFWWQPYDRTLGQAVRASARLLYGRNGQRLKALREGGVPLMRVGARTLRKDR